MLVSYYQALVTFVPLVPLVFGLFAFKNLGDRLKILFYYVCFASVVSILTSLIANSGTNTMPLLHMYVPVELLLLTLFYVNYIKEYINRKYIWAILGAFIAFSVLNVLFFQKIATYPYLLRAVESIILVVFSVLYFYKVMVEAKIKKLSKDPMIWINTGMLFYFSGNFFFHILLQLAVTTSNDFAKKMVYFFWTTNILFYLVLAIGFYKQKKLSEA